jgi:glucose/arabinose dehydrogenase
MSVLSYPLHDTPFGFDWAPSSWPVPYNEALFVGMHGNTGSWLNTDVWWAPTDPVTHRPMRQTPLFVSGWGQRGGIAGHVADVVFAPDGRLLFSNDHDGAIYWVAPRTLRAPTP